jgi:hypothetical protein
MLPNIVPDIGLAENRLRALAKEIATDLFDLPDVLIMFGVSQSEWEKLLATPAFAGMLAEARATWGSALNTRERVDLKTLTLVEEALPQMNRYLHDRNFSDSAKVELFKALQRGAGIGQRAEGVGGGVPGERVVININTGTDAPITIEHERLPTQVLEIEDQ